jgi:hypothetical protein
LLTLGRAGFTAAGPINRKFSRRFFQKAASHFLPVFTRAFPFGIKAAHIGDEGKGAAAGVSGQILAAIDGEG